MEGGDKEGPGERVMRKRERDALRIMWQKGGGGGRDRRGYIGEE